MHTSEWAQSPFRWFFCVAITNLFLLEMTQGKNSINVDMTHGEKPINSEESEQLMKSIMQKVVSLLGSEAREEVTIVSDDMVEMSILFHDYSLMFAKKYMENVVEIDFCRLDPNGNPDFKSISSELGPHTLKIARALRSIVSFLQKEHIVVKGKATSKRFKVYSQLAKLLHFDDIQLTEMSWFINKRSCLFSWGICMLQYAFSKGFYG